MGRSIDRIVRAICLVSTLVAATVFAQEPGDTVGSLPGVEVRTSVDKAEIFVGDQVTYTLTIIHDSTVELIPPPLGANLGAFQVLDYETDRLTKLPDGRIQNESRFVISTFTTGDYAVPPFPVMVIMPDSTRKVVLSESVPIKVESLLSEKDSTMDIKPLAALVEADAFGRDRTWWYVGGGAALVIIAALALYFLLRRRRGALLGPIDLRPPWEIASERLALLVNKDLIRGGRYKEYYYELSDILRWYLGRVYERNVPDMTTEEFLTAFREIDLPASLFDGVEAFMKHSDLVKFARYEPEVAQTKYDFEFVHAAIDRVRLDVLRRQEVQTVTPNNGQAAPVEGGSHGA